MNHKNLLSIAMAVEALKKGEVIAYATESVFGLGCDPDNQQAVNHLLSLKQRAVDKGLILIAAEFSQLQPYIDTHTFTEQQWHHLASSWPGPVTWVMPKSLRTPYWISGCFDSLAVRVTAQEQVVSLCQQFGKPIVSTSANLSGQSPARTVDEVFMQFGEQFPVLDGRVGGRANPSVIKDIMTGQLIRQG